MINAILRRVKLEYPSTPEKKLLGIIEKVMSHREKDILQYRLPWTQLEVAHKFNLTKERVRAIESRLFEKITQEFDKHRDDWRNNE